MQPKIIARYDDYFIQQGVTSGKYFVHHGKQFIGIANTYPDAVSHISRKEKDTFDINKLELLQ